MSEDSWPGLVVDGATGQLVAGGGCALLGAEPAGAALIRYGGRASSPAGLAYRRPPAEPRRRPRVRHRRPDRGSRRCGGGRDCRGGPES